MTASSRWPSSLEAFWVWQNYLDLEGATANRANLRPFIETVETLLGRGQRVHIRKARVSIERPEEGDEIPLAALPSGEQHILFLFGELIRRARPKSIILIDEIERSLHPSLQRAVIHHLRTLIRQLGLQVIVTTHSMEIVNTVAEHEVLNLDDMVSQERARHGCDGRRSTT